MFVGLDRNTADAWIAVRLPWRILRVVLVTGWTAWIVAGLVWSDDEPCSAADPTVCGSDVAVTFVLVLLLLTPILLCWMPLLGCLSGVVVAVTVLTWDPDLVVGVTWACLGAALALVAFWLMWSMWHQRTLIARRGVRTTVAPTPSIAGPAGAHTSVMRRLVPAAVLFAAGLALLGWYGRQVAQEQGHVDEAARAQGRVVAYDSDDYVVTVELESGRRYQIDVLDAYHVGSSLPVLTDPSDPSWARLVAEPADFTGWLFVGTGCLVLGALGACRRLWAWQSYRRLLAAPAPTLGVLLSTVDGQHLHLSAVDDGEERRRVAGLTVEAFGRPGRPGRPGWRLDRQPREGDVLYPFHEPDEVDTEAFGRAWRGELVDTGEVSDDPPVVQSMPATVFGSFRHGARVAVVVDGFAPVLGRLRSGRGERLVAPDLDDEEFDDDIDTADSESWRPATFTASPQQGGLVSPLPHTAWPSRRRRLAGLTGVAIGLVGTPALLFGLPEGRLDTFAVISVAVGGALTLIGLRQAVRRLVLDQSGVVLAGVLADRFVPWAQVHGARIAVDRVAIALKPAETIMFGPFAVPEGGGQQADYTQALGTTVEMLRQGALAPGNVSQDRRTTWSVVRLTVLLGYVLVVGATLWLHLSPGAG